MTWCCVAVLAGGPDLWGVWRLVRALRPPAIGSGWTAVPVQQWLHICCTSAFPCAHCVPASPLPAILLVECKGLPLAWANQITPAGREHTTGLLCHVPYICRIAACHLFLRYSLAAAAIAKGLTAYTAQLIGVSLSKMRFKVWRAGGWAAQHSCRPDACPVTQHIHNGWPCCDCTHFVTVMFSTIRDVF
jgi:hypothetical protein